MTDDDLKAIEERAARATPGPWFSIPYPGGAQVDCGAYEVGDMADSPRHAEDAEFIASARQDVPALVAEVRRLRHEITHHPNRPCPPYTVTEAASIKRYEAAEARVAELERAMAEFQTSPEMAALWSGHGARNERKFIVAWLREPDPYGDSEGAAWARIIADKIERGGHLHSEETK